MLGQHLRRVGVDDASMPADVPSTVGTAVSVAASVAAALVAWQAVVLATDLPGVILPSPGAVVRAGVAHAGTLVAALQYTAIEVLLGWTAGVAVGVTLAGAMAWSGRLRRTIYPYLVAARIVPLVVIAPVLVVVLGPTLVTRVLLATVLTFFPVAVATLDGLRSTPADQIALMETVGAPRWKRFVGVRLPNAIPGLFTGLEIATPLAIEAVVLAEFLAASRGIGVVILTASSRLQTALLFAAMLLLVAFGVTLFAGVRSLHRAVAWDDATGPQTVHQLGTGDSTSLVPDRRVLATVGLAAAGFLGLWHVATLTLTDARLFLAPPVAVVETFATSLGLFATATVATVAKLAVGWLFGAGIGLVLGSVTAFVPPARTPVFTYLAGFRVMPVVAFAPVLLVWFGVSFTTGTVLVATAVFFPIAIGAATGFGRLPDGYADLLGVVDAPVWRALLVRVRYGVPELFAGLKLSVITGLSGVVVAEWFVASEGLGVLVLQQTRTFQPALSFAAVAVLFALGSVLFGVIAVAQRALRW